MPATIVKAAAGLGKTEAVVQSIAKSDLGLIEVYVATHQLALEYQQRIYAINPAKDVQIIYGRGSDRGDMEPPCKKHMLAEELSAAGCSVFPNLCSRRGSKGAPAINCEYYDTCDYIRQFRGSSVRIYVHAYLPLERSRLENRLPNRVVIDESFWQHMVRTVLFPLSLLNHPALPLAARRLCADIAAAIASDIQAVGPILQRANDSGDLLKAVRSLRKSASIADPSMSEREIRMLVQKAVRFSPLAALIWQAFIESLYGRSIQSVEYDHEKGTVTLHQRMPMARFKNTGLRAAYGAFEVPVLIIDASASDKIISRFFDSVGTDSEDIYVPRSAYVIQCHSRRLSTTSLVPSKNDNPVSAAAAQRTLDEIQEFINGLAATGKQVLVVGPSAVIGNFRTGVEPLLVCPPNTEFAHFGALRGIDKYKDCDVAVIIGRNQPSLSDLEGLACALFYDDRKPIQRVEQWAEEERGYRHNDGLGVSVQVHCDHRVQVVHDQIREQESMQAADRLRLMHNTQPKTIYLLSNLPLDIDVDELRSWDEIINGGNRLELAWDRQSSGVLPLAGKWLATTFPDLWKTAEAAKLDVKRLRKRGQTSNGIYIRNLTLLVYEYKPLNQRSWSRCLSRFPDEAVTKATLQKLIGAAVTIRPMPMVDDIRKAA